MKISIKLLKVNIIYYLELAFPKLSKFYFFRRYRTIFNKKGNTKLNTEIEMYLLPALMKKNSIVFDIGANRGTYCYLMQKITSPEKIYAFEPNPREFNLLKRFFPDIHTFNIAISSEVGRKILRIPILKNGINITTRSSVEEIIEDLYIKEYIKVDTNIDTIDNVVENLRLTKLDFMKIDVEGHEFEVLKGAKETLSKMKPILLIEIEQRHHSFPIEKIFNYIYSFDYSGFFIDKMHKECLPLKNFSIGLYQKSSDQGGSIYINNFICINNNGLEKRLKDMKLTLFDLKK